MRSHTYMWILIYIYENKDSSSARIWLLTTEYQ